MEPTREQARNAAYREHRALVTRAAQSLDARVRSAADQWHTDINHASRRLAAQLMEAEKYPDGNMSPAST